MKSKKTLVVGASDRPDRYAYKAAMMLRTHGHPIELLGTQTGQVAGKEIQHGEPDFQDIDTVTMYVGTRNQAPLYDYLLRLKPRRIIFNPGTENPEFARMAQQQGIQPVIGCTLVMLSVGDY